MDDVLHTAIRAICSASHHSFDNISPGALAFRRDMNLDIPLMADVLTLQQLHQCQIDHCLLRANAGHHHHDYQIGDRVLIKRMLNNSQRMEMTYRGPFPITQVHTNGTVTVHIAPNQ